MSRKPFSIVAVTLSILFVAGISLYVTGEMPHSARAEAKSAQEPMVPPPAMIASAQTPAATKQAATPVAPTPILAPPGTELHTIAKDETIPGLLRSTLSRTKYMTVPEFEAAFRQQNPTVKGLFPKPGTVVIIPGVEPQPIVEKSVPVQKDYEVKAVYLTGVMAGSENAVP